LPPQQIAENHKFRDLQEIWLAGDHYKWRAMRTNGEDERYCTGDGSPKEKFDAWARTVPYTLRNPLFHWTHLELKRYFGYDGLLSPETADEVWEMANEKLAQPDMAVHGLLNRSGVRVVCTTDDPTDTLEYHQKLRRDSGLLQTRIYPTFRPDKALGIADPLLWNQWVDKLAALTDKEISDLPAFLEALTERHDYFHSIGCRLSDHGMTHLSFNPCTDADAALIFNYVRGGQTPMVSDVEAFSTYMMIFFGRLDAGKGWTKQLHLGAMRNNNTRLFNELGPDTGFDSIGDYAQGWALSRYLDALDQTDELPKTVLYNLNPCDNYLFGTMIGNFQDGSIPGKVQFGSGWWFLDQKEGMEWQLNALSNLGLLSRFVGMLTDSRSFLSFPRHESFRRILCNLVGEDMEQGLIPRDMELVGPMIRNICYGNAREFFGLDTGD
jgi:glucuronate isomerase